MLSSLTPTSKFYDRLHDIKDYHKRYPNTDLTEPEDDSHMLKEEPRLEFSGEEGFGRYLDLHALHRLFTNAKFGQQVCGTKQS